MKRYGVLIVTAMAYSVAAFGVVPPLPMLPADASLTAAAPTLTPLKHVAGTSFDLRFVTVAQIVDLIYQEAMHTPYVLGPDVLSDGRLVSFRLDDRNRDVRTVMGDFLESLGFQVVTKNGVDYVTKKPGAAREKVDQDVFVYKPRYRRVDYLRARDAFDVARQRAVATSRRGTGARRNRGASWRRARDAR